jgi:hypothetical protein
LNDADAVTAVAVLSRLDDPHLLRSLVRLGEGLYARSCIAVEAVGPGQDGERVSLQDVRVVPVENLEEDAFGADDAVERNVVGDLADRCLLEAGDPPAVTSFIPFIRQRSLFPVHDLRLELLRTVLQQLYAAWRLQPRLFLRLRLAQLGIVDFSVGLLRPLEGKVAASGQFQPEPAGEQALDEHGVVAGAHPHLVGRFGAGQRQVHVHAVAEVELVEELDVGSDLALVDAVRPAQSQAEHHLLPGAAELDRPVVGLAPLVRTNLEGLRRLLQRLRRASRLLGGSLSDL